MVELTLEGKPISKVDLHVVGKSLWARLEFEDGREFDIELEKSRNHAIIEIGKPELPA